MPRPFLTIVSLLAITVCLLAVGPAWDYEHAQAGDKPRELRASKATYGSGMIAFGGKGAEAWRYEYVQEKRHARWLQRRLTVRVLETRSLRRQTALLARLNFDPVLAIRVVFGPAADEALLVFRCESNLYTGAQNGQYLGIAQMGAYARGRYGHSSTALGQMRAAYAYFSEAGWGPWECARIVGVS